MSILLRDATAEDEPLLREAYASTRAMELAMVPWSDEQRAAFLKFQFDAQDSHYREHYPEASRQIILKDTEPVGRLYVLRGSTQIKILDITVLPQYRNAGVGTTLLRELLAEAEQTARTVVIWVEHFNPSQNLFQRLGFSKIEEHDFNHLMEWHPGV